MVCEKRLVVATNTTAEITTHLNESVIVFEVIKKLILILASDMKMPVKFESYVTDGGGDVDADIAINFDVYKNVNLISLWPFYQDRYCFVYSNSKKLLFYRSFVQTLTLKEYLLMVALVLVTVIYHFLVMHFRLKKTFMDAVGNAYMYTVQTLTNGSTPNLEKYPHDKFFLAGLYIFVFVAMFTFLTFFSSQCTVPRFIPAYDQELTGIRRIEYSKSFGIGEQCLNEIFTGTFERRSCMVPCYRAIASSNETRQIKITNEINFQNVLKVSRNSQYFDEIKGFLRRYNENGVFEKIFDEVHQKSYKYLAASVAPPVLTVDELQKFTLSYLIGMFEGVASFTVEITYRKFFSMIKAKLGAREYIK